MAETESVSVLRAPPTSEQVPKLATYQLREYIRSRRFVILAAIVAIIGVLLTVVVAHFRGAIVSTNLAFYGSFWGGGVDIVIILSAVFFGGDAIAGEFQNKTGYFLMGLPIRRSAVYIGKYIAAYIASVVMLLLFLVILVLNGAYYFGSGLFPWQLGASFLLSLAYLAAVLGATFLFSSLFKTSAYGFVLTAILFLFGFTLIEDLLVSLVNIEPWMVISYANSVISEVFQPTVNWGLTGQVVSTPIGPRTVIVSYVAGVGEGVIIMIAYFLLTAIGGLWLFEHEEFT